MMNIYKNYKNWKLKRHIEKFGSKNNGYFNYFNQEWFEEHQETLIWLLNHWLLKYWFRWILRIHKDCKFSEYIDEIKPNTYRIKLSEDTYQSDFRTHQKFSKRIYYAFRPYWYLLHSLDFIVQKTVAPEFSFGFDTLTVYPDANPETTTVDGRVARYAGEQFSSIRSGAGTHGEDSGQTWENTLQISNTDTGLFQQLSRGIVLFDTSSIISGSTVSDVDLSLYVTLKEIGLGNTDFDIVSSNPASNTALATSDYGSLGTTVFASRSTSIITANQYNEWSNLTTSSVTVGGITKYGIRIDWDTNNSFTGTVDFGAQTNIRVNGADMTGTTQDPKLVVTYAILTAIKAIGGIAIADIKTINGLAGASVKTLSGLTYVQPTPIVPWYGDRAINGGGFLIANINYFNIPTTGNASTFGNLVEGGKIIDTNGTSNATRGIFAGGYISNYTNIISYITIATTGDSTDFGDTILAQTGHSGLSDGSRGCFAGGWGQSFSSTNVIDYITISTTGNTTDFGDLTGGQAAGGGISSNTRGIWAGSSIAGTYANVISYVVIATVGNATDFGDLSYGGSASVAGVSNGTRGVVSGYDNGAGYNVINYITIATTGNSTDFGDRTVAEGGPSSSNNSTRGVFHTGGGGSNTIDYITIVTTGNATDFGDMSTATSRYRCSGFSGN